MIARLQTLERPESLSDRVYATLRDYLRAGRIAAGQPLQVLICHATVLRNHFKGTGIELCSIVNAKSGHCTEDCIFCAQSARYPTEIKTHPLLKAVEMVSKAKEAESSGAARFGIVTSGRGILSRRELESLCESIQRIRAETNLIPCASLGILSDEDVRCLGDAGLTRYHHNLETAEGYFPLICTTHSYQERVRTIRAATKAGMEVCAGGIFGLGETPQQRVELAFALHRSVNEGFSGGEKKRNEIFQMAVLEPRLAILDETDSGLDIDALKIVARGVNALRSPERAIVLVTHYQRLLDYIVPDRVHVLADGRIVRSGDATLAHELEKRGYGWLEEVVRWACAPPPPSARSSPRRSRPAGAAPRPGSRRGCGRFVIVPLAASRRRDFPPPSTKRGARRA